MLPNTPLAARPSHHDRILAATAHAGILLIALSHTFVTGLTVAGAIWWFSRREGTGWVAWQAKQAVAYQAVVMVAIWLLAFFATVALAPHAVGSVSPGGSLPADPGWLAPVGLGAAPGAAGAGSTAWLATTGITAVQLLSVALLAGGGIAAYRAYQGHDTRYPILARLLDGPSAISPRRG